MSAFRSGALALSVLMTATSVGASWAQETKPPAEPAPAVIESADWIRRPSVSDMARVYPVAAANAGKSGYALLVCRVLTTGLISDCNVLTETPVGMGFGAAAVAASSFFQIRPPMIDGQPFLRASVQIPIIFNCEACDAPAPPIVSRDRLFATAPWRHAPTFEQWKAARPQKAKASKVGGGAALQCRFAGEGALTDCKVINENPGAMGFGEAALSLVPSFKGLSIGDDGKATAGALVNLTVSFPEDMDADERPTATPPLIQTPSAEAIAAAFPKAAQGEGVTYGEAVVGCLLDDNGEVGNCTVRSETPAGKGFGVAALALAPLNKLSLWSADGRPVSRDLLFPLQLGRASADQMTVAALRTRGWAAARAGRPDDALADARDLQRRFPAEGRAWELLYLIGITYAGQQQSAKAIAAYKEGSALNPKSADLYNNLCWELAASNTELPVAIAACKSSLRLLPDEPTTYDSLGFAYLRAGDYDQAAMAFSRAIATRPNYAHALYGRGIAKLRRGDARGGDSDIKAAERLERSVGDRWAAFGLTR